MIDFLGLPITQDSNTTSSTNKLIKRKQWHKFEAPRADLNYIYFTVLEPI